MTGLGRASGGNHAGVRKTNELISLSFLREMSADTRKGGWSGYQETLAALVAVVEAADDLLEARNLGARERLAAALARFVDA